MTEDKMVGFEQILRVGEGQGSQSRCSPWGCKESDMTEQLKNNNQFYLLNHFLICLPLLPEILLFIILSSIIII